MKLIRCCRPCFVAVFLLASGCSWILVQKPPADRADAPNLACTSSPAAPIIDTAVAAASLAVALLNEPSISKNCQTDVCSSGFSVVNLGLLVNAALFGVSSYQGYKSTSQCRELRQTQVDCLENPSTCPLIDRTPEPSGREPRGAASPFVFGFPR